jgi:hypothetical protein
VNGRWLLPLASVAALAGYFGPWVDHAAAGLVVTGLDLGEAVKFLPPVRSGEVWVWREGFYAPLAALSATCSFAAFRPRLAYRLWLRALLLAVALVAALNLLPPAWTPARLVEPEFRLQTAALVMLLSALAVSPFLALLPWRPVAALLTVLVAAGLALPVQGFLAVLPIVAELYRRSLWPGWGFWLMLAGLLALGLSLWTVPARGAARANT